MGPRRVEPQRVLPASVQAAPRVEMHVALTPGRLGRPTAVDIDIQIATPPSPPPLEHAGDPLPQRARLHQRRTRTGGVLAEQCSKPTDRRAARPTRAWATAAHGRKRRSTRARSARPASWLVFRGRELGGTHAADVLRGKQPAAERAAGLLERAAGGERAVRTDPARRAVDPSLPEAPDIALVSFTRCSTLSG